MSPYTGTVALVRLGLRRDRLVIPIWLAVFVVTAVGSAKATVDLYPTVSSRVEASNAINSAPALVALYGRIADPASLGALVMLKMSSIAAALVGVLSFVLVVRHTRAEEEAGRLELVGATVVGRRAALAAALVLVAATDVVLGLLTAAGLTASGLPAAGSVLFGLTWTGVGLAFAGVAAVAAQLTTSARAANGICASVLGVTYVLRAVGDTAGPHGPRWASWLSPVGWGQLARPYAGDRWAVLLVFVGFVTVMVAVASALAARRDLGAGLLRERRGRATAAPWLRTSGALAWRLQGGLLAWWMLAFAFLGVVLGSLASSVSSIVSSQQAHDMITRLGGVRGLTDAFLAAELGIAGVIASAFAVQATMRLRSEETAQRAEPVLATAVGRVTWAASHLVVAFVGTAAMLLATGVAAGTVRAVQTGHSSDFWHLVAGALVQLPAVWLLAGITVAAFGLVPQATAAGWAALVVFLLIGELGPLFQLKQWALDLSPFAHIPHLPGGTVSAAPLLWLLAIAALLVFAGLVGFRRRDLEP